MNNNQDEVELMHVNITRQLDSLIEFVYPDLSRTDPNSVILATLNTTIDTINARIIDAAPGTSTLYRLLSHLSQYNFKLIIKLIIHITHNFWSIRFQFLTFEQYR